MQKEMTDNNVFFRQLLFLGILVTIALVIFFQLKFFVGAFLGAITMYIVLRGIMFRLTEKRHWRTWIASATLVLAMAVLLLGIGYLVFRVIASEIPEVDASQLVAQVKAFPEQINETLGFQIINRKVLEQVTAFTGRLLSSLVNTTYSFAANVFMMLVILYFMLGHARVMEQKIYQYIPFRGTSLSMVRHEVKDMIFSNAIGIPLIMIGQGLVATLIYWLFGVSNAFFWGFLTALAGLIPMIGTMTVCLPMGIYMIAGGEVWEGIFLILCGVLLIANVDNLMRIVLMKKMANTHPLVVIFGVILGIPLFGFWGIIFGPLLISGFLLLVRIYYREYKLIKPTKGPLFARPGEEKTE